MADNKDVHWTTKAWQGLVLLLVIAAGARVVYGLLVPLLPVIGASLVVIIIFVLFFRKRGE